MKKVKLDLVGVDSNAFSIMAAFRKQARKQGWSEDEIKLVLGEAMMESYDHLLFTIQSHCE